MAATLITVVKGAEIAVAAVEAAMSLLAKAKVAGAAVAKAQAEGRVHLTSAEWQSIVAVDDTARDRLVDAIAKAEDGS